MFQNETGNMRQLWRHILSLESSFEPTNFRHKRYRGIVVKRSKKGDKNLEHHGKIMN